MSIELLILIHSKFFFKEIIKISTSHKTAITLIIVIVCLIVRGNDVSTLKLLFRFKIVHIRYLRELLLIVIVSMRVGWLFLGSTAL